MLPAEHTIKTTDIHAAQRCDVSTMTQGPTSTQYTLRTCKMIITQSKQLRRDQTVQRAGNGSFWRRRTTIDNGIISSYRYESSDGNGTVCVQ